MDRSNHQEEKEPSCQLDSEGEKKSDRYQGRGEELFVPVNGQGQPVSRPCEEHPGYQSEGGELLCFPTPNDPDIPQLWPSLAHDSVQFVSRLKKT